MEDNEIFFLIVGLLIGIVIGAGGYFGIDKATDKPNPITGDVVGVPTECPITCPQQKCEFKEVEASFERSGKTTNDGKWKISDAYLENKVINTGGSGALFNLQAKCSTLKGEVDVYSGLTFIEKGESKELRAGVNTGLTEDWKCDLVKIHSIDVKNSCKLV